MDGYRSIAGSQWCTIMVHAERYIIIAGLGIRMVRVGSIGRVIASITEIPGKTPARTVLRRLKTNAGCRGRIRRSCGDRQRLFVFVAANGKKQYRNKDKNGNKPGYFHDDQFILLKIRNSDKL